MESESAQFEHSQVIDHTRPAEKEYLQFYDDTPHIQDLAPLAMSAQTLKALDCASDLESDLAERIKPAEEIVAGPDSERIAECEGRPKSELDTAWSQPLNTTTPVQEADVFTLTPTTNGERPQSRLPSASRSEATSMAYQRDQLSMPKIALAATGALEKATNVVKEQEAKQSQRAKPLKVQDDLIDLEHTAFNPMVVRPFLENTAVNPIASGPFSTSWWKQPPSGWDKSPKIALKSPPGLGPASPKHQAMFDAIVTDKNPDTDLVMNGNSDAKESKAEQINQAAPSDSNQSKLLPAKEPRNSEANSAQKPALQSLNSNVVEIEDKDPEKGTAPQLSKQAGAKDVRKKEKKEARALLNKAWLDREDARKKIVKSGNWSVDNFKALASATKHYLECRARLASLMVGGELIDEDAKTFPMFGAMDVTPPKYRPQRLETVRR